MVIYLVAGRPIFIAKAQIQCQIRQHTVVVLDEEVVDPVSVVSDGGAGLTVGGRQAQQEVSKWIAGPGVGEVKSTTQCGDIENSGLDVGSIAAQLDIMRASLHGNDAACKVGVRNLVLRL